MTKKKKKKIENVRTVNVFPSPMESTCYVFGVGDDLYFRRHSPSASFDLLKSDFDFRTLLIICILLTIATFFFFFLHQEFIFTEFLGIKEKKSKKKKKFLLNKKSF